MERYLTSPVAVVTEVCVQSRVCNVWPGIAPIEHLVSHLTCPVAVVTNVCVQIRACNVQPGLVPIEHLVSQLTSVFFFRKSPAVR